MSALTATFTLEIEAAKLQLLRTDERLRTRMAGAIMGTVMHLCEEHLDRHYVGKPNKLGGSSTGYWGKVLKSIAGTMAGDTVTVTMSGVGLAMKYYGGVIKPSGRISSVTGKPITRLAIPIDAAAHGKVPAMFGKSLIRVGGGLFSPLAGRQIGQQLFILAKQATIKPDKNILPADIVVQTRCAQAIELLVPAQS